MKEQHMKSQSKTGPGVAMLGLLAILLVVGQGSGFLLLLILAAAVLVWMNWPTSGSKPEQKQKPKPSRFAEGFHPDCEHDNIAIDTKSDHVWLRDAKRGERYVPRTQIRSFKPTWMSGNGLYDHRLEIALDDLQQPLWVVAFNRHGDKWKSAGLRNRAELDEWEARLALWINGAPA